MSDLYLIAKTKSDFSKEGFVSIFPYTDFIDRFSKLKKVLIHLFGDYRELVVDSVKEVNGKISVKFRNFEKERELKFLLNKEVFIDSFQVIDLPVDSHFVHDLIGSNVFRNSEFFGLVKDVINLPSNSVLVIETHDKKEILIPAIKDYIISINSEGKSVILKPGSDSFYNDEN